MISKQTVLENILPYLDEYYLSKDDWDTLVELGVGDMHMDNILKKIPTASKTAFTKA